MKKLWIILWAIGVAGIMILVSATVVKGATEPIDTPCAELEFVWVRGSDQELGTSGEWGAYKDNMKNQIEWKRVKVNYKFFEVDYPAVGVDPLRATEAWVSNGSGGGYGDSVKAGVAKLTDHIRRQSAGCPAEKFVIAGYSQGAQVIVESLGKLDASKVIYVALLGEPKLFLPEGYAPFGIADACSGKNKSVYRAWAPNCYTYVGSLGRRNPYVTGAWNSNKVGLYCNANDFICGSSNKPWDNDGHGQYAERMIMVAANTINKISDIFPPTAEELAERNAAELMKNQAPMDTVILLDSTGSMQPYLNSYKSKAIELAKQTLSMGGRVALAEYRDKEDVGYPKLLCKFGCKIDQFTNLINGVYADGGEDEPEGLLAALMMIYESLDWRTGATKSVIVLTDAGYHSPDKSGIIYNMVVKMALAIDPVNTYIITPTSGLGDLDQLANDTGGKVFISETMTGSFLDSVAEYIVGRPVALLGLEEYWTEEGESFYFDASMSFGVVGEIARYDWDFDGDGIYEVIGGESGVEYTYVGQFEGFVVVRVVDTEGREATMSAKVRVGGEPPVWEEPWRPEEVEESEPLPPAEPVGPDVGDAEEETSPVVEEAVMEVEKESRETLAITPSLGGVKIPETGIAKMATDEPGIKGISVSEAIFWIIVIVVIGVSVAHDVVVWSED